MPTNAMLGANTVRFAGLTPVARARFNPAVIAAAAVEVPRPPTGVRIDGGTPAPLQLQSGWRWCQKCQGFFFSGNPDQGACAAGGRHDASGSTGYLMASGGDGQGMQPGWRWCRKCQGLFFSGNPTQGVCPAGDVHDGSGSTAYVMTFGDGGPGMQAGWRWCNKCQDLFFSGNADQGACPAGDKHDASRSGTYAARVDPTPIPVRPASLPLLSSQTGNLFTDRNDADLHWYLPDLTLSEDIDPRFAFTATQSGQGEHADPFNRAIVTLRLQKGRPQDVVTFVNGNPGAKIQEIPLTEMTAILSSFYTDDTGNAQERQFKAVIDDDGNGNARLTFDSILAASVVGLYQDLTVFGKAVINVSASYQAWSQSPVPFDINRFKNFRGFETDVDLPRVIGDTPRRVDVARIQRMRFVAMRNAALTDVAAPAVPAPPVDTLTQTRQAWTKALPLELKYRQDGYQLKYTVTTTTGATHVIRDSNDLKDFSGSQTEFTELKVLGDISQRYPTIDRLYIGVLSRRIVVVPKRYSIVRSRLGCAATCFALVDGSPENGSSCKFEFDFTIAPEVSRIEFFKLTQEIASRSDLKEYKPTLPNFLHTTPASTLQTDFASSVAFAAGADAKTFAVSVAIHDEDSQTPAVANANLFIMRLCSDMGANLIGTLSLKLDEGYPDPVLSTVVMNFTHTTGTDDIVMELEEGSPQLTVRNQSPLDLRIERYGLISGATITEAGGPLALPANGSISVARPAQADLEFAAEAELALPQPLKKADVGRYLTFQTADVQETQYFVGIHGGAINFDKVDFVAASVTFSKLPTITPRSLKLTKNVRADSTHILIPLENAVFALPGTVNLTVHFVDPGVGDLIFTVDNDFAAEPVLVLSQADIDNKLQQR